MIGLGALRLQLNCLVLSLIRVKHQHELAITRLHLFGVLGVAGQQPEHLPPHGRGVEFASGRLRRGVFGSNGLFDALKFLCQASFGCGLGYAPSVRRTAHLATLSDGGGKPLLDDRQEGIS